MGAATAALLRSRGHRVIGIDIADADVTSDLSVAEGRAAAVAAVLEQCGGVLDGLVLSAGLGSQVKAHLKIAAVNYFGAVAMLDGLRDALARGSSPAAVVISSVASVQSPWAQNPSGAALEAAKTLNPDVILLDIGLPKMNGYDTCPAIRARTAGEKNFIISVSGGGEEEKRRK